MLRFIPRSASAALVRALLLLTLLAGSSATGPVRPSLSVGAVMELATDELQIAWQQTLLTVFVPECD